MSDKVNCLKYATYYADYFWASDYVGKDRLDSCADYGFVMYFDDCQDEYWPFWSACQSGYLPLCCNALEYFYIDDQYYDCTCNGTHGIFTYECYCELLEYDTALWCVNYEPEVSLPRDVALVSYDSSSVCYDYYDPTEYGLCRFTLMDTNEDYLISMEDWSYYFYAFTHGYINEDNLYFVS